MTNRQQQSYNKLKALCEVHGAKLISTEYISKKDPLLITCKCCGEIREVKPYLIQNKDFKFMCRKCAANKKKPSLDFIGSLMREKGAVLISNTYISAHKKLQFKCSICGDIGEISWHQIQMGSNKDFLCHNCQPNCRTSPDIVKKYFEDRGVELVSTYVNNKTPLEFKCTSCGKVWKIGWQKVKAGENKNFLCDDCNKYSSSENKRLAKFEDLKKLVESKGAKLLDTEKVSYNVPFNFTCSICGTPYHNSLSAYLRGNNPNFLCYGCLHGKLANPAGDHGHTRNLNDNQWLSFVKRFFNIKTKADSALYSTHHILRYSKYPEYRTSIVNGFPLLKEYHSKSFKYNGYNDAFHTDPEFEDIENWPCAVKLPYHTYNGFKFLNLNSKLVTEILYKHSDTKDLYNKKKVFAEKGLLFIPIMYPEIFNRVKQEVIFSMLRNRLWKYFPDIYKYTGQEFKKVFARKLKPVNITFNQAEHFFAHNHIQGFIRSSVYIGLVDEFGEIYQAMSFGPSREKLSKIEMYRLATKCNTFVVGGVSKLFKYYVDTYNPESIVSFCDVRFSSINPDDTVYVKHLGFKYVSYSKPNYKWLEPYQNLLFSRQAFQKHLLKEKLKNFDPNLTETQNMENAGYVKLYDCGNFKFLWEKH